MNYHFANLERLLEETIRPDQLRVLMETKQLETLKGYQVQIVDQLRYIKEELHILFYSAASLELGQRFIQDQVYAASACAKTLQQYLQSVGDMQHEATEFYRYCCLQLSNFIDYMRTHFPDCFDYTIPVPMSANDQAKSILEEKAAALRSIFKTGVEQQELLEIVLAPLDVVVNNEKAPLTYHIYTYYSQLLDDLVALCPGEVIPALTDLITLLVAVDFNAPSFLQFYTLLLEAELRDQPHHQKMEKLAFHKKQLSQAIPPVLTNAVPGRRYLAPFYNDLPKVTAFINDWIAKEEEYLQLIENHSAAEINGFEKINTGLSVWQLSVFIAAFLETGVFITESEHSYAATIRSVGRIVKTVGQETISLESLRTKIYSLRNMDRLTARPAALKAAESCRDLFYKCYQTCRKMTG